MKNNLLCKPDLWQIPPINQATLFRLPEKIEILENRLNDIFNQYQKVKLANSLAVEDTVLLHQLAKMGANCVSFVLQTGKLNAETLQNSQTLQTHYPQIQFEFYHPNQKETDDYVRQFGEFAFYESVDLRKRCCFVRKIEPLNRALNGADAWLTGQRREQSITRQQLDFEEHDATHRLAKFNPIYDWSEQEVWAYIKKFSIPYNDLYHKGYPSIGCEPCSMPVKRGEDIRAGRWWWEQRDSKECGLHQ